MAHKVFNDDWITLDPPSTLDPYIHIKATKVRSCTEDSPEISSISDLVPPNMVIERAMCGADPHTPKPKGGAPLHAARALYDYCVPPKVQGWVRIATIRMNKTIRSIHDHVLAELACGV